MKSVTRRSLIATGAAFATGAALSPAEAATGSVAIRIFSARFYPRGLRREWRVDFEGAQYPLSVGGVSAGATIGASGTDLIGVAHHLHDVHDIEGIYSAVGAGLSIAGGRQAARLANARGVLLRLKGRPGRLHVFHRPERDADFAQVNPNGNPMASEASGPRPEPWFLALFAVRAVGGAMGLHRMTSTTRLVMRSIMTTTAPSTINIPYGRSG